MQKKLITCELPKWFENKAEVVKEQSKKLFNSTNKLKELLNESANDSNIDKAIESVHNDYVALETLFDD